MKHIAFVIESLNLGGAETSLVTFLNNLDFNKYKVDLILFRKDNFFIKYVPRQVNVIYIDLPKIGYLERVLYKIKRIVNFNKLHNAQNFWPFIQDKLKINDITYDIVHAYNQGFATYYTSRFILADKKYAWINIDYQNAGYNIDFDMNYYKDYTKIVAISDEVKRGFFEEAQKISLKIDVEIIKLFADDILINKRANEELEHSFNEEAINIVTVCRLSKQKGLHLAIESCAKLLQKGHSINWYVVGEGSERDFLEKLIMKYNLQKNFKLLGKTLNPFPYMKACDIYVQTSLFEGWGLTLIEAVLLKKLVVTTNFPTAYDIVEHKKTGLISKMDSDNLVMNIDNLLNDEELKEEILKNLEARINFDKKESLERLEKLHT